MTVINTNVKSLVAKNSMTVNSRSLSTAMQQLSTGKRINSSKDDAAGLAVVTKMSTQIRGLNQAVRNANDGISMIQTAEGAMNEVTNMMQRMRELALQSASDTNTADERAYLDLEFQALKEEINRIGNNTQWNGTNLLDKSFASGTGTYNLQVGANANQTIDISIGDFRTTGGTSATLGIATTFTGNEQVNTISFAALDSMAAGDKLTFNVGTKSYTFTAGTALADGTAIVAALAADANFENLLGLSSAAVADAATPTVLKLTGTTDATYAVTVTEALGTVATPTVSASSYTPKVQTSVLTLSGTFAAGDKIKIETGSGTYEHTVAAGEAGSTVASRTALASGIAGGILAAQHTALGIASDSASGETVSLVSNPNQTFTVSATHNGSTGGDLAMINSSNVLTSAASNSSITNIDAALKVVSESRAEMGALINRLTYAADNLTNVSQNTTEARSRVEDTDYAAATTELARTQIIQQAATAMLAQANQQSQGVLSLLQG